MERLKARFAKDECGCQPSCGCKGSCGSACDSPGLLDRLKARFHRDDCDCGCGCGAAAVPATPAKPGEPLKMPKEGEPSKKLPDGEKKTGISAPKELDLTPTSGKPLETPTQRPF